MIQNYGRIDHNGYYMTNLPTSDVKVGKRPRNLLDFYSSNYLVSGQRCNRSRLFFRMLLGSF
jgi:hypothetical protein